MVVGYFRIEGILKRGVEVWLARRTVGSSFDIHVVITTGKSASSKSSQTVRIFFIVYDGPISDFVGPIEGLMRSRVSIAFCRPDIMEVLVLPMN